MDFNSGRWELAYGMGFVDYRFGGNGMKSFAFNPERTREQIGLLQSLDEIGFPGPVTFESDAWALPDRAEGFRNAMHYWRICEQMALPPAGRRSGQKA